MAKFKVGDFVSSEGWSRAEGHEILDIKGRHYYIGAGNGLSIPYDIGYWDQNLILAKSVSPKSPIIEETVTVKKIAADDYGNLTVYYAGYKEPGLDTLRIEMITSVHTPEEIRDMAKTLVDIADFIDGEKK